MNKQISIPGYISAAPAESWESEYFTNVIDGVSYRWSPFEPSADGGAVIVCKHELSFEVPSGWDIRPGQIAALEAKKAKLQAEFSAAVVQINRQIAQLQAIEYTPEAA